MDTQVPQMVTFRWNSEAWGILRPSSPFSAPRCGGFCVVDLGGLVPSRGSWRFTDTSTQCSSSSLVFCWMYNFWLFWLVVWNMNFIFRFIYGIILPIDELIFFRGVETTNQLWFFMQVKQCHFYHPWLGMITIPPIEIVMTGRLVIIVLPTLVLEPSTLLKLIHAALDSSWLLMFAPAETRIIFIRTIIFLWLLFLYIFGVSIFQSKVYHLVI